MMVWLRGIDYCYLSTPFLLSLPFAHCSLIFHTSSLPEKQIGIAGVASQPHGQPACGRR